MNLKKSLHRTSLALAIVAAIISSSAIASAADTPASGAHATAAANPHAPQYNHPYRHGAIPTLAVHAAMQHWNQAHPQATNAKTLTYGGGTGGVGVLSGQAKVYLVYYGTQWGSSSTDANGNLKFTGDSVGAAGAAQQMFKGIGTNGELWQADLTQWCDGAGVTSGAAACPTTGSFALVPYQTNILKGVWYDNTKASPSAATAAQLASEAIAAAAHFGNTTAASNRYAYYVIMSPKGTNPDNYQGSYCAWHDYTADAGVSSPYGELAFSNQPYNIDSGAGCGMGFVNSPGTLDGYTMTLGHEWHEMMSDQFPAGGWTNHDTGGTYAGQENSDECAWIAPGSTGGAANIAFSTGTFAEQASWSNDTNSCAISHLVINPNDAPPMANFSDVVTNLVVNFTDHSSDSLGTITNYNWNFGDGATSTATNPSHTYAAAGTYSVTETIFDSVNANAFTTRSITVSPGPPSSLFANFSFTASGLTANFTDTSTDGTATITSHAWSFGDGTTSTAANPSHAYAAAGSYNVTETVTDNRSSTNSKSSTVAVAKGDPQILLQNSSFETTGSWTATSGVLCTSGCSGESAHGGHGFAWLGGYSTAHTDTLSQQTTSTILPGTVTLQFFLHIDTAETSTTQAYDKLTVGVYNGSGALLKTLATYSNLNSNTGYLQHSFDMSPYVGQRVTVKFTATDDASLQTSFVLDDVSMIDF